MYGGRRPVLRTAPQRRHGGGDAADPSPGGERRQPLPEQRPRATPQPRGGVVLASTLGSELLRGHRASPYHEAALDVHPPDKTVEVHQGVDDVVLPPLVGDDGAVARSGRHRGEGRPGRAQRAQREDEEAPDAHDGRARGRGEVFSVSVVERCSRRHWWRCVLRFFLAVSRQRRAAVGRVEVATANEERTNEERRGTPGDAMEGSENCRRV